MKMSKEMIQKANEFFKARNDASFSVLDESGYPSASAVWLINQEDITEVYFSTFVGSNKYNRVKNGGKASICCYSEFNNLTLIGEAEILTDQASKTKHWQEPFIHIYTGGDTDPNYCIIKFVTKRVSMHIDHEGAEFTI